MKSLILIYEIQDLGIGDYGKMKRRLNYIMNKKFKKDMSKKRYYAFRGKGYFIDIIYMNIVKMKIKF